MAKGAVRESASLRVGSRSTLTSRGSNFTQSRGDVRAQLRAARNIQVGRGPTNARTVRAAATRAANRARSRR